MSNLLDKTSLALLLYMESHQRVMESEIVHITKEAFNSFGDNRYSKNLLDKGLVTRKRVNPVPDGVGGFVHNGWEYSISLDGIAYLEALRRNRADRLLQDALDILSSFGIQLIP